MPEGAVGADTHYDILGLPKSASADEVAKAYHKLAKRVHPDAGGNSALFRAVDEAYKTLSNPAARRAYDARISRGPGPVDESPSAPPSGGGRHFYREEAWRRRKAEEARRERAEEAAARQARAEEAAAAAWAFARAEAQRVEAERMATAAAKAAAARANAERLAWMRAGVFQRYPAGSLTLVGAGASLLNWAQQVAAGPAQPDWAARYWVFAIALTVLVTGLTAALGWSELGLAGRPKEPAQYRLPDVDGLSVPQFEALLGDLFNSLGYRVRAVGGLSRYGGDLIIEDGQHSVAVHVDRYSVPMAPSAVYQAATARRVYGTCCAMVVGTSWFGADAWRVAERQQVTLWDRNILIQQLAQLSAARSAAARTRYSRPYGAKLLKAELRRGVPVMLKLVLLVLMVPLALLVVVALVAGASAGSTPGKHSD